MKGKIAASGMLPVRNLSFVINVLNYKTFIALKLASHRLILGDSAFGLAR